MPAMRMRFTPCSSLPETTGTPCRTVLRDRSRKQFALYCDIIDEAGGIATIATILASNNISIKNIGIVHNREFEEGVLRIEFYDEDASAKATACCILIAEIPRISGLSETSILQKP